MCVYCEVIPSLCVCVCVCIPMSSQARYDVWGPCCWPAEYPRSQRCQGASTRHHSISLQGLRRGLAVAAVTSVGWVNNLGVSQGLLTGVQVIESSDYQVKFVSKERSHHHHHDGGEGEGEDNVDCQLSDVLVGSLKCWSMSQSVVSHRNVDIEDLC